jgi:3-dehydroquinate dehydratase/shikimate dehydrogenase
MGPAGLVTRLHPAAFGSCWTYAGDAAPGQVSAAQLLSVYRVRHTTPQTALFGVTGRPLAHSASPAMHNAAFAALGLDAVYVPFETSDAGDVLEIARALRVKGLSVTAPLKGALRHAADRVDDIAKATGAVNTLGFGRDGLEGRNFDVDGFLEPLRRRDTRLEGAHAVVLGAGGAARSAVFALKREGADVQVAARRHGEAVALARDLDVGVAPWPPPSGWDLLVNATPVGTWPAADASPMPDEALRGGLVYDLVYNPRQTALLTHARREGIEGIGGLEMLVAQAQRQCEWWTGHRPDGETMTRAAIASMQSHQVT